MNNQFLFSEQSRPTFERQTLALLENMNDGVILLDTHWRYTYINHAAEIILQKQRADLLGNNIWEVHPDAVGTLSWTKYHEAVDTQVSVAFEHFSPSLNQWIHVQAYPSEAGLSLYLQDITQQKQHENEIKQQEQMVQIQTNLLELARDAILVRDPASTIVSWNKGAEELYGWTAQEAIGKITHSLLQTHSPESREALDALILTGEQWEGELVHTRRDGTRIIVESRQVLLRDEHRQPIAILEINRDITERKVRERENQEQSRFLAEVSKVLASSLDYQETLANIAQLVVPQLADWFAVDLVDAGGQFELVEVEHKDPEQVRWARSLRELYPIDPNAPRGIPHVVRTGQSAFYPHITDEILVASSRSEEELAIAQKIGYTSVMIVPLVARGQTLGAMTFVAAESGRKYDELDLALAEEVGRRAGIALDNARLYREIAQSRDQLNIMLQGVADGIVVYGKNGQIVYANEAAARMTDSTSVQDMLAAPGLSLVANYEITDEQRRPIPHSQLTHIRVLAGEPEAQATISYVRSGTEEPERWSLVKSSPVFDEHGAVTMVVTIFHDVTEQVLLEHRKDEFISMTSHELKTPVTSLKGFTSVLQRRLTKQGDEQSLHYLARMDVQLNRLTKLISDLLDISRMQTGKLSFHLEVYDLDPLIRETVDNVQAATTTHQFHIEGSIDARVLGDKDRLGQVFTNLLTNASKYSPQANKIIVRLSQDQKQASVSVQDFGIGIDKIYQRKIFERFFQVTDPEERTYPGLGIGLYISKEIIERHDGRIEVQSCKGEGATFSVILPLHREEK